MTKTALITGVSSGIGLAQARLLLENGLGCWPTSSKPLLELGAGRICSSGSACKDAWSATVLSLERKAEITDERSLIGSFLV